MVNDARKICTSQTHYKKILLLGTYREEREHLLELLLLVGEHVGHDEDEEGHELDQIVLQGRPGQQELPGGLDSHQVLVPAI